MVIRSGVWFGEVSIKLIQSGLQAVMHQICDKRIKVVCEWHYRLRNMLGGDWSVRHRRAGPQLWPLIRRSLKAKPEVKYYLSNAEADVPLETMARVTGSRWRVEELLLDCCED